MEVDGPFGRLACGPGGVWTTGAITSSSVIVTVLTRPLSEAYL
jgi:hypothetical protein